MSKLVILRIGAGSFATGFPVTLQIGAENSRPSTEVVGELPPEPDLPLSFNHWQATYRNLDLSARPMGLPKSGPMATLEACRQAAEQLRNRLNRWLQAESFRSIREKWLEKLRPAEPIRILLQTQDLQLQKLPWQVWDFIERYPNAELALSAPVYEQVHRPTRTPDSVSLLAILGDSAGIDVMIDRNILEQLPHTTGVFLVEPDRQTLTDRLWEQSWDIFFFAGHSSSSGASETGRMYINPNESLTIDQLKYALRKAVDRGLQLAIFNSCDGLGLARQFADLQIPQLIVMREPVPDRVAQAFLKYFLEGFSQNKPLYQAVREARERLQGLEGQFPCASWLPVIYQNPAELPMTWATSENRPSLRPRYKLTPLLLISLAIAVLVLGVRYLGMLQPLELEGFDYFLRLRPQEKPDSHLLVVTVTEADVQAQSQEQRRGSLSDQSLAKLLEKLEFYQPQLIGLDIYRDYPVSNAFPALAKQMQQDRLVAVCKISDPQAERTGVAPPPEVPTDQLGFSDLVLDPDTVVRRHLLALTPPPSSPCTASYAFSVQLALRYLAAQNIRLQFMPDGAWRLGKAQFQPIEAHTGGYQGIDAWGHQILLNYRSYRSPKESVAQVTLNQVLSGQVDANAVKNRIVLIGTTAESFQDYSLTPYRTHQRTIQKIPGVILQAQMVSQLISAATEGRPLLWTWALWQEVVWVMGWSLLGGGLAWVFRRMLYWVLGLGIALISLAGICFIVLTQWGGWIPLIPAGLAAMISSTAVQIRQQNEIRQNDQRSLRSDS